MHTTSMTSAPSSPSHTALRQRRTAGKASASAPSSRDASPHLTLQLPTPPESRSSSVSRPVTHDYGALAHAAASTSASPPPSPSPLPSNVSSQDHTQHPRHYCFCDNCVPPTPGVHVSRPHVAPTVIPTPFPNVPSLNSRIQALVRESQLLWAVCYVVAFLLRWSTVLAALQLPVLAYLCSAWWDPSATPVGGLPTALVTLTTLSILELVLSVTLVIPHRRYLDTFYTQTQFPSSDFDAAARWAALRQLVQAAHPTDAATHHPTLATPHGRAVLRASRPRTSAAGQPYSTVPHIGHFWHGWFKGAAPCNVLRDNVKQWLAWAFFNLRWEEADVDGQDRVIADELEAMVQYLEAKTGASVPTGFNLDVECMRVTLDEKRMAWRGGIYYACMTIVNLSIIFLFRLLGYTNVYSPDKDMILHIPSRYTRPSTSGKPLKKPILLLHGLAVGMTPYLPWCLYMYLSTGRPTVFLHMPCVSIRLFAPRPPTPARFNAFVQSTWARFPRLPRATLVGSSLGTAVAAWAIKNPATMSHVVDSAVLTDPVSFGLCFVDVAANFLYKSPKVWSELVIRALGAREPNVAHYLYRHFWWFENIVWPSEWRAALGTSVRPPPPPGSSSAEKPTARMAVFLSEMDSIVNTEAVARYLQLEGEASVSVIPDAGHGAFVFTPGLWDPIRKAVQETARNAGATEAEIERV